MLSRAWVLTVVGGVFFAGARARTFAGDVKLFHDGTLMLWARGDIIAEPPVPLLVNGLRLDDPRTPGPDLFDAVEIFERVQGTRRFPLTRTDLIPIGFFRSTYQRSNGTTATLGTSVVGSPSFREPGRLYLVPTITQAAAETGLPAHDRVRITLRGELGSAATVTSVRAYPQAAIGRTVTRLSVHFEARRNIALDPRQVGNDAFRLLTVSSMFSDSTVYDANVLRWADEVGGVQTLRLSDTTARGGHLLPAGTRVGCWFELVKEPGSTRSPDSPSIRVDLADCTTLPGRTGIQAFLLESRDPAQDSLSVWLEWLDVPNPLRSGTSFTVPFTITATPPAPVVESRPAARTVGHGS